MILPESFTSASRLENFIQRMEEASRSLMEPVGPIRLETLLTIFYEYRKARTMGDYAPPSWPKDMVRMAVERRRVKIEFLEFCWPAFKDAYDGEERRKA
jgi:hypothetical protein